MTVDDIAPGVSVFIDANPFIYHFTPHTTLGPSSRRLMERIALHRVVGMTSAHVLTDVAHRMMTIEAMARFAWPEAGIASRLSKHYRRFEISTDIVNCLMKSTPLEFESFRSRKSSSRLLPFSASKWSY